MSSPTCTPHHNWFNATLTFGLCCGLVISYLPQHFRIIHKGSSEGFSPWFLLLGCTSAAAGFLNMVTLQWGIVKCCRVFSFGSCIEASAGVIQIGLQWFMFNFIMVLYMVYYPPHLKYIQVSGDTHDSRPPRIHKGLIKTEEWSLSIVLFWVVTLHLLFGAFTTSYLLSTAPTDSPELPENVSRWATFLGVTAALLAAVQYAPQLVHTYRLKLVGALSIPMMLIQSPGAVLMVTSIALRPGTNWTSWITFAVAGIMQGSLLIMCIMWKFRQAKLGVDDFGNPVGPGIPDILIIPDDGDVPGLVVEGDDPVAIRQALSSALESAVQEDVRDIATEETPLLVPKKEKKRGWFS
ncbi:hypothetical protein C8J56DRAFT_854002 [Mycena floridula]|nr:hypothetical protein C8J56DRAFT_854002 [Mycena floridula]